jgi:hypothetical protein
MARNAKTQKEIVQNVVEKEYVIHSRSPLSLEAPYPLTIDGKVWKFPIAYIEASKYPDTELSDKIQNCDHPSVIKFVTTKIKTFNSDTKRLDFAVEYGGNIVSEDPRFDLTECVNKMIERRFQTYAFMKKMLDGVTRIRDEKYPFHEDALNAYLLKQ